MFVWLFFWSVNDEHSLHLQSDFKTEKINLKNIPQQPIDASEGESTLSHSQGEEVQIVMFELRLQHGPRPHISAVFHVPLVKQRKEQAGSLEAQRRAEITPPPAAAVSVWLIRSR